MVVFLFLILVGTIVSAEQLSHPCQDKTCRHRVTCTADQDKQDVCVCNQGYSGDNCSDINECKNGQGDPCGHRGVCLNAVGSYKCNCLHGWKGTHCQQNTTGNPPCMPGYCGKRCKVSACGHGYAVNASKSFKCYCDTGWTHVHENDVCSDDIDECTMNICQNSGNCTNTNGSYICECIKPWDGQNCSHYNTCLLNPCENEGTCTMIGDNASKTFICSCKDGWQGLNCSDDVSSLPQQKNRTSESAAASATDKSSQHVSVIVGATVGALAFVVIGCLVGYLLYKRKRMQIASMEVPVETSGGE